MTGILRLEDPVTSVRGIGEAKKTKLLRRFKSIGGIARADEDEIASAAGVSREIAQEVLRVAKSAAGEKGA